ncbi:hypothetical protein AVEN_10871-1, partial [Araneus ventricosus]
EKLFLKEYIEFQVRKNKAYATIYLSIEKEYRILISEVDDSTQTWKILQKHFRPDSCARVIYLTDEFFSCKILEGEDIGLYAARLKKIIIDLDAGKPIADWYQAFQLIRYLPTDYQDEKLFLKEYIEFQVRKNKAYATIYLSIEKEYRILISEVDDSTQTWKILQKHFRPDSCARVIYLTDEFFSCKILEGEDIGLYAARLKKIIIDLDAGKPIADWYQAFQLIRYLPTDYQGMVQIIYR